MAIFVVELALVEVRYEMGLEHFVRTVAADFPGLLQAMFAFAEDC